MYGFPRVAKALGDDRVSGQWIPAGVMHVGSIHAAASVIHHVYAGLLITDGIALHDIPVEQREGFVERSEPAEIRVVQIGISAIAEADMGCHQRQSGLTFLGDAVPVEILEAARVHVGLPLQRCNVVDVDVPGDDVAVAIQLGQMHGSGQAIDDLIVPLVEHGNAQVAVGKTANFKSAVTVAFGEPEVVAVRIAHAHIALREGKGRAVVAVIKILIRRTADVQAGDLAADRIEATARGLGAQIGQAAIDGLGIRKADGDVVARRSEFLEVGWLADSKE